MTLVFRSILAGLHLMMRWCAWRHPAFRAQLAEHDYVAQIRTRDADIGRWFAFAHGDGHLAGRHPSKPRRHGELRDRRPGRAADGRTVDGAPADRSGEAVPPARRRSRRSRLRVHPGADRDAARRLALRHRTQGRRHALHRHDQWRAVLRPRQGRQDPAPDADRLFRHRCRIVDDRSARAALHAAAQDQHRPARSRLEIAGLFARPHPLSDAARRFRPCGRTQSAECAASPATCASAGTRRSIWSPPKSSG